MVVIKVSLKIIKGMVKDSTFGKMDRVIQDNGKVDLKMDQAHGNQVREIFILANGFQEKYKDMVFILLQLVKDMKGISSNF